FKAFLPVEPDAPTYGLRAGGSPLYKAPRLGDLAGLKNLYIKDDGVNPTSSLKDRASAMGVTKAKEAGATAIACSSTGNAASSLAGSAAACGLDSYIFVPSRAPAAKVTQLLMFGAHVLSVQGNYEDTFSLSAQAIDRFGWYNRNAAINPYLLEGKKTVSFEIALGLGFKAPDYVAVSVGDGCTIAGVWKGFKDLYESGFISSLPRLISVQASGCCPINRAASSGSETLIPMEENTIADSIAVGVPRNFKKALMAIKESNAICVEVSDDEILEAMKIAGKYAGVFGEPAGIAATAGILKLARQEEIDPSACIVSIVTGNGLKDIASASKAVGAPVSVKPDMQSLLNALDI
ncbi:MAG: threonine synthase, partial [Clostridiales bacterium]|nr:threonine synthase [Clostridiales bacterium]